MMDVLASEHERALTLFESLSQSNTSRLLGDMHGRRYEAFLCFARSHLTTDGASLRHAQEAYMLFKGMKYLYRAGECALRAVRVGGGARWRGRLERLTEAYPRSLLAREYERATCPINRIRGRRRELMIRLATTPTNAVEIGRSFGMARETVRYHVKAIYRTLGIDTRLQLVHLYRDTEGQAKPDVVDDVGVTALSDTQGESGESPLSISHLRSAARSL